MSSQYKNNSTDPSDPQGGDVIWPAVTITQSLWLQPGAAAGFGTAAPPDPTQKPPTVEINGSLKMGVAITAFSTDGTFANPGDTLIPVQSAVKTYVDAQAGAVNAQLASKANLNGAANQDFSAQNLSVSGNLLAAGQVSVGATTAPRATLDVHGSLRVAGPVQAFGSWSATVTLDATSPVYSVAAAPSDGLVTVLLQAGAGGSGSVEAATPIGSVRALANVGAASNARSYSFPVRNGDSYQITLQNPINPCTAQLCWLAFGAGS
jgi:hypothetical protein